MKGGSGISGAIGYILGTVIIVPLLLYLISIIFYDRKVTDTQINQYIANSENIQVHIPAYISPATLKEAEKDELGPQMRTIHLYLDTHGGGDKWYFSYVFYLEEFKKYFSLMTFEGVFDAGYTEQKDILMTVNKYDLNNPIYGRIDNPVPILGYRGVSKSIRVNNRDFDTAYINKFYRDNVRFYLTYIMPKKEFKARFGN